MLTARVKVRHEARIRVHEAPKDQLLVNDYMSKQKDYSIRILIRINPLTYNPEIRMALSGQKTHESVLVRVHR